MKTSGISKPVPKHAKTNNGKMAVTYGTTQWLWVPIEFFNLLIGAPFFDVGLTSAFRFILCRKFLTIDGLTITMGLPSEFGRIRIPLRLHVRVFFDNPPTEIRAPRVSVFGNLMYRANADVVPRPRGCPNPGARFVPRIGHCGSDGARRCLRPDACCFLFRPGA